MSAVPTLNLSKILPSVRRGSLPAERAESATVDEGDVAYRHAHLYVNPEGTWAVYRLGGVDWDGRPDHEHENFIQAQAYRWGALTGRKVRMWGVPNAFPTDAFLARQAVEYADHARPRGLDLPADVVDAREDAFAESLARKAAYIEEVEARRLESVIAVQVTSEKVEREHLPLLLMDRPAPDRLGMVEDARQSLRAITGEVARDGWEGEPVSEDGLSWVMQSTRAPGFRAPTAALSRWSAYDDGAGFMRSAPAVTAEKFGTYATVRHVVAGETVTRYMSVLHVSDIDLERDTLEHVPWLGWLDSLGPDEFRDDEGVSRKWQVQWAAEFSGVSGSAMKKSAVWRSKFVRRIAEQNEASGVPEDRELERLTDRADEIVDEVGQKPHVASRWIGHVQIVVSAESLNVLQEAVASVIAAAEQEQGITLSQEPGQWASYRRGICGSVWSQVGHEQRLPAPFIASAVPNVSAAAGDTTGFVMGLPASSNSVYVFDPFGGPRHEQQGKAGVGSIAGAQGSGKTATAVAICADLVDGGVPGVAFSPDGMIAQIGQARTIKPVFREIAVTQVRTAGIGMPSLMIPVPERDPGQTDAEYAADVDAATATRLRYSRDVLTAVLPGEMQRSGIGAGMAIGEAVADAGGAHGISPWEHVAYLEKQGGVARDVARQLRARAATPSGRLVFPDPKRDDSLAAIRSVIERSALFTAITLPGIVLPDTTNRQDWTDEEFESVPALMTGLQLSRLSLFADRDRGWFIGDEIDIATGGVSGMASFCRNLIYDVRRYGKFAALLVKSMSTLEHLDEDVTSLFGFAMQGAVGDMKGARAAARLLDMDPDSPLVAELTGLREGEFFVRGWDRRVRRIPIDQSLWDDDVVRFTHTRPEDATAPLETQLGAW